MILLIPVVSKSSITPASVFTFHYDSINSNSAICRSSFKNLFTFHYDSINSNTAVEAIKTILNLHFTMILLILHL